MLKDLSMNMPLVEALEQLSVYVKFIKEFVTKKRIVIFKPMDSLNLFSAIVFSLSS